MDGKMFGSMIKAITLDDIETMKSLIRNPANLNLVYQGQTAMTLAVEHGSEEMVDFLLQNGAHLESKKTKSSALILAIKSGSLEMVNKLLDLGVSVEEGIFNGEPISPLRLAARSLKFKMVKLLTERGADVNAKGPGLRTALHEVGDFNSSMVSQEESSNIRIKIATHLLKCGADINVTDANCRTPLDGAIIDNVELSKFFIKEGAAVRRVMDNGFHVEYLLYVTKFDNVELVRMCLQHGADFSHFANVDDVFITAYHLALKKCGPRVVQVFWQFGCPVDLPLPRNDPFMNLMRQAVEYRGSLKKSSCSSQNKTVLKVQENFMNAIQANSLKKVLAAIKQGAEAKGTSMMIPSPLHYLAAGSNGNYEIARILLENGVAVNHLEDNSYKCGRTPLFRAFESCNLKMYKELLMFGAAYNYVNLVSNFGLMHLVTCNDLTICQIYKQIRWMFKQTKRGSGKVIKVIKYYLATDLEMARIFMNCVDRYGRTIMTLALEKKHVKLAEKLIMLRISYM